MRATCGTWRAWAALAIALTACGSARAFYWPGWPGSQLRSQDTLVTQPRTEEPVQPTPQFPGGDKPPVGPNPGPSPTPTPEPASGLIGLLGLGALAAARRWRRKPA